MSKSHPAGPKSPARVRNLTTVTIPAELEDHFNAAVKYYRMGSGAALLQSCALALIQHYQRGDKLITPILFQTLAQQVAQQIALAGRAVSGTDDTRTETSV